MLNELKIEKIGKWLAFIAVDEDDSKLYSISYFGKGGALVNDTELEKAKDKFIRGMELSEIAMKILKLKK